MYWIESFLNDIPIVRKSNTVLDATVPRVQADPLPDTLDPPQRHDWLFLRAWRTVKLNPKALIGSLT